REVRAKVVVLEDKPGAWHGNTDVRIARRRRAVAIRRPGAEQTKFLEHLFHRSGICNLEQSHQSRNSNDRNQPHTADTPTPITITAARAAAIIGRSQNTPRGAATLLQR